MSEQPPSFDQATQQPQMGQPQMGQPMYGQQPMMGQPMYQQQQPMMGQPMYQQQQPMMGQPMYGQPQMGQPMYGQQMGQQTVVIAQPTSTQTVVSVARNGDADIFPAMMIFIIGWCCCVWLAGFAYVRSPNTTAKMLAWASIGMGGASTILIIILIIVYSIAGSRAAYYDYNYENCYDYAYDTYYYC